MMAFFGARPSALRPRHGVGLCLAALAWVLTVPVMAQDTVSSEVTAAVRLQVDPADVASIDAIINAVYDVISGPKGQARDFDRLASLFVDGARMIPTAKSAPQGVRALTVEDYFARSHPFFLEKGFFEIELGRTVQRYGRMAHVWSAYESRFALDDPAPFARGVNSFQLVFHEGRWWVVNVMWEGETKENPLPDDLLSQGQ